MDCIVTVYFLRSTRLAYAAKRSFSEALSGVLIRCHAHSRWGSEIHLLASTRVDVCMQNIGYGSVNLGLIGVQEVKIRVRVKSSTSAATAAALAAALALAAAFDCVSFLRELLTHPRRGLFLAGVSSRLSCSTHSSLRQRRQRAGSGEASGRTEHALACELQRAVPAVSWTDKPPCSPSTQASSAA